MTTEDLLLAEKVASVQRHLERVAAKLPPEARDLCPMTDASDAVILHLWQAVQTVIDLVSLARGMGPRLARTMGPGDGHRRTRD